MGILALLLGLTALPWWLRKGDRTRGAAVPAGYHHYAIDLSHHNGDVTWDSLKVVLLPSGHTTKDIHHAKQILPVSRVILKATEGATLVDERFAAHWAAAGKACKERGAYHFFRPTTDPRQQARHFIENVHLSYQDLPPILDIEVLPKGCSRETLNQAALVWLQAVEHAYGRRPIVYTSDRFALDVLSEEIRTAYPLWIARYHTEPPRTEGWWMWQCSDKAVIYGIRGYVDLSVYP